MTQPVRDVQTVTPAGESVRPVPDGVRFRDMVTRVAERGTLVEMYDPRWGWHPAPLVYADCTTVRPGMILQAAAVAAPPSRRWWRR
jgi:dTDP-4-dehydrorhamnose 3,5-epimerase